MSMLKLNTASNQRLPAQLTLNGTFQHTLRNSKGVECRINLEVLQCTRAIQVSVKGGPIWLSVTLGRPVNPRRVARFIESATNGTPFHEAPYAEEDELVSEIESTLREVAVKRKGSHHFCTDDDIWVSIAAMDRRCKFEVEDTTFSMTLPTDTEQAYLLLHENLQAFLSACRSTAHSA
tara:strand:- start:2452 stop:2985 length:534 start_codon:yes stop_codon:yes gene_type:complete